MSTWATKWAWEQPITNSGAKFTLLALADFADAEGYCYPSQETLSEMTGIKDRTLRDHLTYLEEEGYIKREDRRGKKGRYTSDGFYLQAPEEALKPKVKKVESEPQRVAKSATGNIHRRQNLPPDGWQNLPMDINKDIEPINYEPITQEIRARETEPFESDLPDIDLHKDWQTTLTVSERFLHKIRGTYDLPQPSMIVVTEIERAAKNLDAITKNWTIPEKMLVSIESWKQFCEKKFSSQITKPDTAVMRFNEYLTWLKEENKNNVAYRKALMNLKKPSAPVVYPDYSYAEH